MTTEAASGHRIADLDVLVLAGGRGSRLGGVDKSALVYAGAPLRRHVLSAVRWSRRVVWVGESTSALAGEAWPGLLVTREEPAFAGPVAALAAGLAALDDDPAPFTLVLAADLPHAAEAIPDLLRQFGRVRGGVLALDETGRRQYLLGVYPSRLLRQQLSLLAAAGPLDGLPFRRLVDAIDLTEVRIGDGLCADVDTVEDAARLGIRLPVPSEKELSR